MYISSTVPWSVLWKSLLNIDSLPLCRYIIFFAIQYYHVNLSINKIRVYFSSLYNKNFLIRRGKNAKCIWFYWTRLSVNIQISMSPALICKSYNVRDVTSGSRTFWIFLYHASIPLIIPFLKHSSQKYAVCFICLRRNDASVYSHAHILLITMYLIFSYSPMDFPEKKLWQSLLFLVLYLIIIIWIYIN
jgi:hypothetical protein